MIEGRYIHADEAQAHIDSGWDVEPLWAHWPYCLAHRKAEKETQNDSQETEVGT